MNEKTIMENYDEYILDNIEDAPEAAAEWAITNDSVADWAVRKVREEQAEYNRLEGIGLEEIDRVQAKIDRAAKRRDSRTGFLLSKLAQYFGTVPHKETATTEKYQLLSGSLVYTKPKAVMEKDDDALLAFLHTSGNTEYIKTEERPAWGEFKKRLEIVGRNAIDKETGEIVECIRVTEKPGSFDVK